MQLDLRAIPRYRGPNPPNQKPPKRESVGIPFLALRITHRDVGAIMVVRALEYTQKHPAIVLAYHDEIETFKNAHLTVCECVGGGRMNAVGGDLDLYDCSTTYGPWGNEIDEILVAFRDAMGRGELLLRNIKPYPDYHPSKFTAFQDRLNAMHPNTGVHVTENVVLWPATDRSNKKRKTKGHVTL